MMVKNTQRFFFDVFNPWIFGSDLTERSESSEKMFVDRKNPLVDLKVAIGTSGVVRQFRDRYPQPPQKKDRNLACLPTCYWCSVT